MVSFGIELEGDVQIRRELLRWSERAGDARPAFQKIAEFVWDENRKNFRTMGRHASGGWAPLKPATIDMKIAAGMPRPTDILFATGAMFESLTGHTDGTVFDMTDDELRLGTDIPYAVHHQHGAPKNNLPQRRALELTEVARIEAMKILQAWIVQDQRFNFVKEANA